MSGTVPLILSFYPPLGFWRHLRALLLSLGGIVLIFGSWDVFATWRGHWSFSAENPPVILNLPLEEVLFFVVIPFCCLFTWEAINFIAGKKR